MTAICTMNGGMPLRWPSISRPANSYAGVCAMEHDADGQAELAKLFMANRAAILRYLRGHGAGDAAEDLLQDLWIRVDAAAPEHASTGYLMRMAHNLMIDRARTARQRGRREHSYHRDALSAHGEADAAPGPERTVLAREELRRVQSALGSLGPRTEHILRRHRLQDTPQRQIAAELEISLSAVEKHLQRAYRVIAGLRAEIADEEPSDDGL